MNCKNIIFDLGGVIINLDIIQTLNHFVKMGVNQYEGDNFFDDFLCSELCLKLETGFISKKKFIEELKKTYMLTVDDSEIVEAWNSMLLDTPAERIDQLNHLKNKYNIYLLSNTNEIHIDEFMKRLHNQFGKNVFDDIFVKQYYSHLIHLRKPDKEIYEYVLNDANLKPEETIFLDDNEKNVNSAKKCGIDARLVSPSETIYTVLKDCF